MRTVIYHKAKREFNFKMFGSSFDMKIVNRIKEFTGRKFESDKSWTVPAYGNSDIYNVVQKYKFTSDDETTFYLNQLYYNHASFAPDKEPESYVVNEVKVEKVSEVIEVEEIKVEVQVIEETKAGKVEEIEESNQQKSVIVPDVIETTCTSQKLNQSFPVVIKRFNVNAHIDPNERTLASCTVTIENTEISAYIAQIRDPKNKGLYVEIYKSRLPESFIKKANLSKTISEILLKIQDGERVKEQILEFLKIRKAEKAAQEVELRKEASKYSPTGWAYNFGCDTADSNYFVLPDDMPKELRSYASLPSLEVIDKYIKFSDITKFVETLGTIGSLEPRPFSYGGHIFSMKAFQEISKVAQERADKVIAKENAEKEAKLAEEARIKELAQGREVVKVVCESRPHKQDLSGAILNSPAPTGGSFLIYKQIDKPTWAKMKATGVRFYTNEMIEDFDMFGRDPGWRYSITAIAELIKAGFAVQIEKQVFITVESLFNFYQENGQNNE